MNKLEEEALRDVEEHGCHVLHVMEDGDHPSFVYSIGIEQCAAHPEIIVTGLGKDIAHWIVNEYNSRIQSGGDL